MTDGKQGAVLLYSCGMCRGWRHVLMLCVFFRRDHGRHRGMQTELLYLYSYLL